jgi:D5 N terminal like
MSWGDEGWQQAARDYQAGRKDGRHQRIAQMDFKYETPGAKVIHLGNQHDQQGEARPPAFSDDALALRFIDQHKEALRYVPSLGKWLRWDGKRWCFDDRLIAYDRMRRVCRAAAAECNQPKLAKLVASNKTAAAAERFARSDQRIIATVESWTPIHGCSIRRAAPSIYEPGRNAPITRLTCSPRSPALRRTHRAGRRFGMDSLPVSLTTNPNYRRISSEWPGIHSPARHKSMHFSSSMGSAQTERRHSSMPLPLARATITGPPLSRRSQPRS